MAKGMANGRETEPKSFCGANITARLLEWNIGTLFGGRGGARDIEPNKLDALLGQRQLFCVQATKEKKLR